MNIINPIILFVNNLNQYKIDNKDGFVNYLQLSTVYIE